MVPEIRKSIPSALLLLLVFSILAADVFAVGIRPARLTYPFVEGKEFLFEFTIINRAAEPSRFALYTCGTFWDKLNFTNVPAKTFGSNDCTAAQRSILSQIDSGDLKVEDAGVFLNPNEEKKIYIKLKLPAVTGFQPGIIDTKVGAIDLPLALQPGQTIIGGIAAVEAQLLLKVPYPGKRLVLTPHVEDAVAGQKVKLKASVVSEGTEKIDNAVLNINLFDPNNVLVKSADESCWAKHHTVCLEPRSIAAGEGVDYSTIWDSKTCNAGPCDAGTYNATYILTFDTQTLTEATMFRIGGLQVDVTGVETDPVQKGGIAKIRVRVSSRGGDTIPNVYADVAVKDKLETGMAVIKTQQKDLKPFEKASLEAFWETGDAPTGVYDAIATLHYASNQSEGRGTIEIKSDVYPMPPLEYIALAVIVILLVCVLWIFKDRLNFKTKQDEGTKNEPEIGRQKQL